jgi:hypothetical protein
MHVVAFSPLICLVHLTWSHKKNVYIQVERLNAAVSVCPQAMTDQKELSTLQCDDLVLMLILLQFRDEL